jgi:nucleoside-diphosphate-sugar epimerase
VRILLTGGSGVLGRALIPLLAAKHDVLSPGRVELDLYDGQQVRSALRGVDAVYHLATRIPAPDARDRPGAWDENNRLRAVATRVLAEAALEAGTTRFVLPSVTFVYPSEGEADEDTPLAPPASLASMIAAEAECRRFSEAGGAGIILRLGLLWGPGTGNDGPIAHYGATLHIADAGTALAAALTAPPGVYNVVADGERVSSARFKATTGWRPVH